VHDHLLGLIRRAPKQAGSRNDNVGLVLGDLSQRLGRIPCFRHYRNVGLIRKHPAQAFSQQNQIMHQDASNRLIVSDLCVGAHSSSL
jgi:hypothetical protein